MNIVLLSGGSGKRLWPLSNDVRSKQFIKFFKNNGEYESMVQRVYRQINEVDSKSTITIATSRSQVSAIINQLNDSVDICVEPCRRDTFPAIALASAYLVDVKGIFPTEAVVVCPVDPYVNNSYYECVHRLYDLAVESKQENIFLMGINPTIPSSKYGYIIPKTNDEVSSVLEFKEKPTEEKASEYIRNGGLWNGGVFAFKLEYVLGIAKKVFGTDKYEELYANYANLEKISFDYAVVEKEKHIGVLRYNGNWIDAGTWATLTDVMSENIIGEAQMDDTCENVHIVNELDVPIVAMGMKNVIISASPDGILVSDKEASSNIKKYVDEINREAMYAEKSWGCFKVIDAEKDSLTIKVNIKPGDSMNYHSHQYRDEVWVVVSGKGKTLVDGMEQYIEVGDVITMKAGCRHMVTAITELTLVEIQLGKEITVHDKKKYPIE